MRQQGSEVKGNPEISFKVLEETGLQRRVLPQDGEGAEEGDFTGTGEVRGSHANRHANRWMTHLGKPPAMSQQSERNAKSQCFVEGRPQSGRQLVQRMTQEKSLGAYTHGAEERYVGINTAKS